MRNMCMTILAGLIFAAFMPAVEKQGNLTGTWILDPAHSDSGGQVRRSSRIGSIFGGGFPGMGIPGGGYPGGGYPGSGRRTGGGYPGGRGGDDGGETGGEFPRGQMQDLKLEIVQTGNDVQTTRKFAIDGEDQTITQKFLLDGSESTNPGSNGRGECVSKSTWKNGKLVNTGTQNSSTRGQSYSSTLKEEYSLSKDGKVLTIKTTRTTARGGETSFKQVFNKQEPSQSPE
jgi:hypothetical protein